MANDTMRVLRKEDPTTAYVQDIAVAGLRTAFIRLVPRGSSTPRDTISAVHADVDLDDDGQLIGVTVVWSA